MTNMDSNKEWIKWGGIAPYFVWTPSKTRRETDPLGPTKNFINWASRIGDKATGDVWR